MYGILISGNSLTSFIIDSNSVSLIMLESSFPLTVIHNDHNLLNESRKK